MFILAVSGALAETLFDFSLKTYLPVS